jgi:hypothetical protein
MSGSHNLMHVVAKECMSQSLHVTSSVIISVVHTVYN